MTCTRRRIASDRSRIASHVYLSEATADRHRGVRWAVIPQAAQAHVSRKSQRLIHENVTRCVTWCYVTIGTVENLNTLKRIVWRKKYGRFTTINITEYEHFTRKIMNNSNGKASSKRQKSLESTRDTQDVSFIDLTSKRFIFRIFTVVNRPYFVPHTIPYNVFKFSTFPLIT